MNRQILILLSLIQFAFSLPLDFFRVYPDPSTTVPVSLASFSIECNQPVETNTGIISLISQEVVVWSTLVVSRQVWVTGASIRIDIPSGILVAGSTYELEIPAGAFSSSLDGSLSPALTNSKWSFSVSATGPTFFNSTLPAGARWFNEVNRVIKTLSTDNIQNTITTLSNYYNRFFQSDDGVASSKWLFDSFKQIASDLNRPTITVQYFNHTWKMPSIIVTIPPTSPLPTPEYVIVGAHLDSINRQNWTVNVATGRAPGADDDASGVAILLDIFRVLAKYDVSANRYIQFIIFSGEEEGLYGSADIAADYERKGINVACMLQLDQVAYVSNPKSEYVGVFTDNTDPILTNFIENITATYSKLPIQISNENNRADSDFHSFTKHGYRTAYIAEGNVDDIVFGNAKHTRHDVIDTISLDHALEIAQIAIGYIVEAARLY